MTNKLSKLVVVGGVAALTLFGVGCQDKARQDNSGTGGSGSSVTQDHNGDGKRLGDGKIGRNNGVVDDGEGPLEGNRGKADDKIGKQPGVWNDGEGPIEKNPNLNRPSDSGKSTNVK